MCVGLLLFVMYFPEVDYVNLSSLDLSLRSLAVTAIRLSLFGLSPAFPLFAAPITK